MLFDGLIIRSAKDFAWIKFRGVYESRNLWREDLSLCYFNYANKMIIHANGIHESIDLFSKSN